MHPLAGIWAKLDRGDEHFETYKRTEEAFAANEPDPIDIRLDFDEETGSCAVVVDRVPEIPLKLGILIGDAIHNWRSALDQLVFELAFMDSGGQEIDTTSFPGSETRHNFLGHHVQTRLLAGLTITHRTMLKRFQPYRQRKDATLIHAIKLLHDLSNDDKHRVTQPVLICPRHLKVAIDPVYNCSVDPNRPGIGINTGIMGRPLEAEAVLCQTDLVILGPSPKVKVNTKIETVVAFRNGSGCRGGLERIAGYAREIVEFIAPEFERPKSVRQRGLPRIGRIAVRTPTDMTTRSELIPLEIPLSRPSPWDG